LRAQEVAAPTLSIAGVVKGSNGFPLPYGTASLREREQSASVTSAANSFSRNLAPGTYHLRLKQLGFVAFDTTIVLVAGRPPSRLQIVMAPIAFKLASVTIKGSQACLVPDSVASSDFATILAELRKNADRERLLVTSYPFEYRLTRRSEKPSASGLPQWGRTETVAYRSDERGRYSPGKVIRPDFTIEDPGRQMMMIPVLEDLGDTEFLRSHCFKYLGTRSDREGTTHRIDFRPVQSVRTPDIEGSVFLDSRSYVIRRAIFRLTEGHQLTPPVQELEVTTTYREVFPGVTVIDAVESVQRMTPESYGAPVVGWASGRSLSMSDFFRDSPEIPSTRNERNANGA
jgi:hypothetical protein